MLPKEITSFIGKTYVQISKVESGAIKKFADAVDDRNQLYWDDDYANKSKYGSIIAPPGFFGWPVKWTRGSSFVWRSQLQEDLATALAKAGFTRRLAGEIHYDFFFPIRAGDLLLASSVIQEITEHQGQKDKLINVITETTYTNQNGEIVAKELSTIISR